MNFILRNWRVFGLSFIIIVALGLSGIARATDAAALNAIDNVKKSLTKKDYNRMWQEMDKLTVWLEAKAPRDGLSWPQAELMIKAWIKKNWHENVIEVKALSEGGMETTTERHQGSFYGWSWDTGEKTVTTDFVFEAKVKAINAKGKVLNHRIRFHFDKSRSGWLIKRAGVM